MFNQMANKDVDFWGITKFHGRKEKGYLANYIPYDYLPEYIQGHFLAVRGNMLKSYEFRHHWDSMPTITYSSQALAYHEAIFTQKFSDFGFKWSVYADSDFLKKSCDDPLMWQPVELLKETRCPIIKRNSFFYNLYKGFLYNGTGETASTLYAFLQEETNYNLNLIWDNILRTNNMFDIKRCLNLQYVLSSTQSTGEKKNAAAIIYVTSPNCCTKYMDYLNVFNSLEIPLYLICKDETIPALFTEKKISIAEVCYYDASAEYSIAQLMKKLTIEYEYICNIHFSLLEKHEHIGIEESCIYNGLENTSKSAPFVLNIFDLFEKNPRLGLVCSPTPIQADYSKYLSLEWGAIGQFAESLSVEHQVPFDAKKPAPAPYNGFFWCRSSALKSLVDYIEASDESCPLYQDNTGIFSTLFSCLTIFVQNQKYYSATVLSDTYASIELTNLRFYLEEIKACTAPNSNYKDLIYLQNQMSHHKDIF